MQAETSIRLTLEQRKLILQLMNYSYKIPPEFHGCVSDAIKKYATRSYGDEAINEMVQRSQSVANSGFLLRQDSIALFRGKFAEWLACIEYNALKNNGSVIMTIINPDPSSKADLLHFIKVGDEFRAIAGPDIKSGGSDYVFDQWKKIVTSRYDIPMVDFDGALTTEEGLKQLTKARKDEFEQLSKIFPRKRPIPSAWTNQDELRLRTDYFKEVLSTEGRFIYSPEIAQMLKHSLASPGTDKLPESDWLEFSKKCKEIFSNFGVQAVSDDPEVGQEQTEPRKDTAKPVEQDLIDAMYNPLIGLRTKMAMLRKYPELRKHFHVHPKFGIIRRTSQETRSESFKNNQFSESELKQLAAQPDGYDDLIEYNPFVPMSRQQIRTEVLGAILPHLAQGVANVAMGRILDKWSSGANPGHRGSDYQGKTRATTEERVSPRQHQVSGYVRVDGTPVRSYTRGGRKD